MAEGSEAVETADLIDREPTDRLKAAAAIAPFLFLGFASVVLLLGWGLNGLWAFMILPPILFISVLGWLAFRHGFVRDLGDERRHAEGEAHTEDGVHSNEPATEGPAHRESTVTEPAADE